MSLPSIRTQIAQTERSIRHHESARSVASRAGRKALAAQHDKQVGSLRVKLKGLKAEEAKLAKGSKGTVGTGKHTRPAEKKVAKEAAGKKGIPFFSFLQKEWWKKHDPYFTIRPTPDNAKRLVGYYEGKLKLKNLPPKARDYFAKKLKAAQDAHRTPAGVRRNPALLRAAAQDLRERAAKAYRAKRYAENTRLLQKAQQLEADAIVQESGPRRVVDPPGGPREVDPGLPTMTRERPWSPTAPGENVAPSTSLTRAGEGEDGAATTDESTSTESTESTDVESSASTTSTPWYSKWWAWLLGVGVVGGAVYFAKKGKGGGGMGSIKLKLGKLGGRRKGKARSERAATTAAA